MRLHLRLISIVLTLVLLTKFAACAKPLESSSTTGTSANQTTTSQATEATTKPAEPVTLEFLAPALISIEDFATNEFTKWMEEQSGIQTVWSTIPSQGREEKLSIILSTGDLPDVMMSCEVSAAMMAKYGAEEKLFLQLDELIDKSAPNLLKSIAKFDKGLDLLRMVDGHIYSLPVLDTCQHCEHSTKMWLYDPWLQKLNITYPTTTEEFYQMLKAFKDNDPNGNGKADELPLVGASASSGWHSSIDEFLMNAFVYYDRGKLGYYVEGGVVKNSINAEGYREGLRYLNKLFGEGLIYEGSLTQDYETAVKLTESEGDAIVGASPAGFVGMFANLGGERAMGFRPLSPIKGPAGVQHAVTYPSEPWQGNYVISAESVNPEAAVKFGDLLYTREATLNIRAGGMRDSFWRDAKEGEVGFDGKPANWFALQPWQSENPQNESWIEVGVWDFTDLRASQAVDTSVDLWSAAGNEYMLYKVTMEQYAPYRVDFALPPLTFTLEEQEEVAFLQTEIQKMFDSTQFNFITGNASLDADWATYLADLEKIGLAKLMMIYQTAYDRQYK